MQHTKKEALRIIRRCIAHGRYAMTLHFRQRIGERGLVWPDILAVIDSPSGVRSGGLDEFDRDKWILWGIAGDGLGIELVCALDEDKQGDFTVLVTLYTN